jgi:hypothetical protein
MATSEPDETAGLCILTDRDAWDLSKEEANLPPGRGPRRAARIRFGEAWVVPERALPIGQPLSAATT